MTKIPTESWDITGLDGEDFPPYRVAQPCAVPGCRRPVDHTHHIVRRSFLGGPFDWVRMPDGVEIGNLTGLCYLHHEDVTVNRTDVTYDDGVYYWKTAPLDPQPPLNKLTPTAVAVHAHSNDMPHDREVCPTCKRKMPKEKIETPEEDKKPRATWAVSVPMEERENGADVLDELLEAARDKLDDAGISYSTSTKAKYHVLALSLGLFIQHFDSIASDGS